MSQPVRPRLRPNVLAHPSPTTGRFVLLIVTVLGGIGLLAGNLVHSSVRYRPFLNMVRDCIASTADDAELRTCMDAEYRITAWFQLGGLVVVSLLSLMLLILTPVLIRRRNGLKPATVDAAQNRVAELAAEAGLRRVPRLFAGKAGQRDAFVFGLPGRYRMVLPKALLVRWRYKDLFDPVVRHELAHLRRHDVPLAWLAATVWIAAIPVLLTPILLSLLRLDFGLFPSFFARCVVLLAVVWLVRRQVLRSREYDADLIAARHSGDWRPLWTVLQTSTGRPRGGLRQLISHHPTAAQRMAVLGDPARLPSVSYVDGVVAAFLAGTLAPVFRDLLNNFHSSTWNSLWAGLLLGPVLGVAVGAGLWRQALVEHVNGEAKWPGGVVAGVVSGLLLASLLDFSHIGLGLENITLSIFFAIVIGSAITTLSAATGRIWADAAGRLPAGRRGWIIGLVINSVLFGLALWALQWLLLAVEVSIAGGVDLATFVIGVGGQLGPLTYVALVPVGVTMVALLLRRRVTPVPAWLLDDRIQAFAEVARRPGLPLVLLSGLVPGILVALTAFLHHAIAGSPVDDADRLSRYLFWVLTGTLAAMAVSFAAVASIPRSGAAVGLVSGAAAALTAGLGISAVNSFLFGNGFSPYFWWLVTSVIAGQWFIGYLLVAPLAMLNWQGPWHDVPGWILATLSTLGAGLVCFAAVIIALA
jgi:Zn-dependent protease with chaperone function